MEVFRVLLVEDDDSDAATLERELERYGVEHGVELSIHRETSAFSVEELAPRFDLVLLDIELPGINGMEAAEALREHKIDVPLLFVTNLAQYAVHGYAVDALDFLVKPVTPASVTAALGKALRVARRRHETNYVVQSGGESTVIPLRDLIAVEVRAHDLVFHVVGQHSADVQAHGTLAAVERDLGGAAFVRISASCLVNMGRIRRVRRDSVIMDDGEELWFSRGKKRIAMQKIAEYLGGTV